MHQDTGSILTRIQASPNVSKADDTKKTRFCTADTLLDRTYDHRLESGLAWT